MAGKILAVSASHKIFAAFGHTRLFKTSVKLGLSFRQGM